MKLWYGDAASGARVQPTRSVQEMKTRAGYAEETPYTVDPGRIVYSRAPLEAGHLSNGGALTRPVRTVKCADCGEPFESTSPHAERCAPCAKVRTRARQDEWMRKNRGKKIPAAVTPDTLSGGNHARCQGDPCRRLT